MAKDCGFSATGDIMDSKKPKKQRKAFHEKPLHLKSKDLSANLSKTLRKEIGKRSFTIRKGDDVKVMRGDYKGKTGKIASVNYSRQRILIEKLTRKKSDGTEVMVPFKTSNLQIESLDKSDEKRFKRQKKKTEKEAK